MIFLFPFNNYIHKSLKSYRKKIKGGILFFHKSKSILVDKTFLQTRHKRQLSQGTTATGKWMLVIDSKRQEGAGSSSACANVVWLSAVIVMLVCKLFPEKTKLLLLQITYRAQPHCFQSHHYLLQLSVCSSIHSIVIEQLCHPEH